MGKQGPRLCLVAVILIALGGRSVAAETVSVAVAANFLAVSKRLAVEFESGSSHRLRISSGSSGQLYAQIRHGAPFQIFLSADQERPRRLEEEGLAVKGSRYTYALGRLVLWSRDPGRVDGTDRVLAEGTFRHLAIANPRTAPYGEAARTVLQKRGLWERLHPRLAVAQSVVQALRFVASGQAELGFLAWAQVKGRGGSMWLVPETLHAPLRQDVVLLKRAGEGARVFHDFLRSERARRVIREAGYTVPGAPE